MGKLIYDGEERPIFVEDRTLAHLKVVVAMKLRRHESFIVSWHHSGSEPGGRSSIWLHPSIPLQFVFDEPDPPQLDAQWIENMMHEVNSTGEIRIVDHPIGLEA